ncbi:MAG: InlB B-repeat-containing protein [Oscillospiraceae bacterium]|nr:InlB B-repeat-containing protein [Oscillospiraceae bacterium]
MGGASFTGFGYTPSTGAITIAANKIAGDIVIRGACTPNAYIVRYNGNGNTGGATASSDHVYDREQTLQENGFTRAYTVSYRYNGATGGDSAASDVAAYSFKNWNTAANGAGSPFAGKELVTNLATGGTVDLFAQWTSAAVTLPSPTRDGFAFLGWYSDPTCDAGSRIGDGGTSYTPDKDVILYAKWLFKTYTITLEPDVKDFGEKTQGYSALPAAQTVTVTNTGNTAISGYTVTGEGEAFAVTYTSAAIEPQAQSQFTIQPVEGLVAGTYSAAITVETAQGTSDVIDVSFTVYSTPTLETSGDTWIYRGQKAALVAEAIGGKAPYTYLWSTTATSSDITVSPRYSTEYTVTIEDALGVRATASVLVTVKTRKPQVLGPAAELEPSGPASPQPSAPQTPVSPQASALPDAPKTPDAAPPEQKDSHGADGTDLTPADEIRRPEQAFDYGSGQILVVIPPYEGAVIAKLPDEKAVIETLLSPEEFEQVADGDTVEIRLDVRRMAEAPPEEDRETIEKAVAAFEQEIPDLTLGSYLDISLSKRVNAGDWQAISDAGKTIEVVIDVPDELLMENREYFILRSHEGGYTLLEDQDKDPKTVTVLTQYFSTYAIAYRAAARPSWLWLWILLAAAAVVMLLVILCKKKKGRKKSAME